MTGPDTGTTNYAGDSAYVGVQAATVHGGVHYYSLPADPSPAEKFETGVRWLDGSTPDRARQLIHEAIMDGHTGNEVCFYWQLALVSGRTRHEMPEEDAERLRQARTICHVTGGDAWADGVKAISRLLDSAQQPDADLPALLKDFDGLGEIQRAAILRHFELFLEGPLKDQMWHRALQSAKQHQMADSRAERVWKFFQPEPTPPRRRPVRPADISTGTWIRAVVATAVLAVAAIHIGYLLARELQVFALLVYLLGIVGGCCAARSGMEWRFRSERRRAKDEEYGRPRERTTGAPAGGFANKVDQRFDHYFARYVPRDTSRSAWLAGTAGIRKSMRDEIVEIYREQRTGVEKISWLIRYRVGDVKKRWENGTLWSYRWELATPLATKVVALAGLAVFVLGIVWAVESAARIAPLSAVRSVAIALAAGVFAVRAWAHIVLERRRCAADEAESAQMQEDCMAAFERWQAKLADKPSDPEMATWLNRDRKVLLDEALRHYGLVMSNMVAYAFIEAPGSSASRARVLNGPWRYTRYQLLLFLLTADGVRQLSAELDFARGTFHDRGRTNYRYEAVAAVRVRQADDGERSFELVLVNGERIQAKVIGPGMEELEPGETPGVVSEATLDAAGLHHTLHVMEGIAAEGKQWIAQERRRKDDRRHQRSKVADPA
ncbi:hypothetical protein [Actinomadura macrotermitis]|uniref:Uncharacterized protein n=1 Tax=Actinomadura macrotermitis TaxID=2585200 RepID=A0A7K0BU43_9ACTN|nr:hypothetical protein [Actinomadura macrotermitis]MQY04556.1 hypothetical protein [Actinomadura macrotermitis]